MTKGTFIGMVKATPEKFQFSVKIPETITLQKRLDVNKSVITDFEECLDKTSPLKDSNKLGAYLKAIGNNEFIGGKMPLPATPPFFLLLTWIAFETSGGTAPGMLV